MHVFVSALCGRFAALVAALSFTLTAAMAGEKVVVSTPALHSLVAMLLAGVDSPALLFSDKRALAVGALSSEAASALDRADMVVWVGPEYEAGLAARRDLDPSVAFKSLTLSATTPLISISRAGEPDRPSDRHDMRFWLDPRLAKVAVGRIASNLVRVYPDDGDRILENEIALKKQLKAMEQTISEALDSPEGVPLHMPESDVLYLAWRFNLTAPSCPAAADKSEAFGMETGPALYFAMMKAIEADLLRCRDGARRAS